MKLTSRVTNLTSSGTATSGGAVAIDTLSHDQSSSRQRKLWTFLFIAAYGAGLFVFIAKHEVFRDEVRAYSIARTADSPIDLVRSKLVNEGHPSLWYLVLWLGSQIWDNPAILKTVSFLAGLGLVSAVLLTSPFPFFYRCMFALGSFPLQNFSVISRGYAFDALLITLLAVEYARKPMSTPWRIGVYNALLANTSVYGAMVACAFLPISMGRTVRQGYSRRSYLFVVSLLTALGVAISVYTMWPTRDNLIMEKTAMKSLRGGYANLASDGLRSLYAVVTDEPGWTGYILTGYGLQTKLSQLGYPSLGRLASIVGVLAICALLIRWPVLLVAFGLCFISAGLFSKLVYTASIVHMGIIATFLFALVWIAWSHHYTRDSLYWQFITYALGISLFFHASDGLRTAWINLYKPYSSSKAAGMFLKQQYPNAIVICEPDVFCESLPYYTDNKIYLVREARFSHWVYFVAPFNRTVTLRELMDTSEHLRASTGQVVLVSLSKPIEELGTGNFHWAYGRAFEINEEQLKQFSCSFAKVGAFTHGAETYVFYKHLTYGCAKSLT